MVTISGNYPMKTITQFLQGSCLVLSLLACSDNANLNKKSKESSANIGVAHCCSPSDVYMYKAYENIKNSAQRYPNVRLDTFVADDDQHLQEQQIEQLIASDLEALLMTLVIDKSQEKSYYKQIIERVKAAKIPVVFYVIKINQSNFDAFNQAYYVGSIPAQSGILQGELIVKNWQSNPQWDLNGDGVIQYVVLKGRPGNPDAEGRTKWVAATIENYPGKGIKAERLDVVSANWRKAEAQTIVNDWMGSPLGQQIEVIIANNDDMALGAIAALEAKGLSRPVFGVDALPQALQAIRDGKMVATVKQDVEQQAAEAFNLALNLATDTPLNADTDYKIVQHELMVPYIAIDRDNVQTFLK